MGVNRPSKRFATLLSKKQQNSRSTKGFAASRQNPSLREKTLLLESFVHVFAHRFGHEKTPLPWRFKGTQRDGVNGSCLHLRSTRMRKPPISRTLISLPKKWEAVHCRARPIYPVPLGRIMLWVIVARDPFTPSLWVARRRKRRFWTETKTEKHRGRRCWQREFSRSESLHSMVPLTWENAIVCGIFASLSPSVRPACPVSCFSIFVSVQKAPNPRRGRTRDDGRIRPKGYLAKQTGAVANGFAKQAAVARCKRLCKARCRRFTSR